MNWITLCIMKKIIHYHILIGVLIISKSQPTCLFNPLTKIPFPCSLLNLLQKLILKPDVLHSAFGTVKIWFLFLLHGRYHFG